MVKKVNTKIEVANKSNIIGSQIIVSGGDITNIDSEIIARDKNTINTDAKETSAFFDSIYSNIEKRRNIPQQVKSDLIAEVKEIQEEAKKGNKADQKFIARQVRNIKRMAPDILEVIFALLLDKKAAFLIILKKIVEKAKAAQT